MQNLNTLLLLIIAGGVVWLAIKVTSIEAILKPKKGQVTGWSEDDDEKDELYEQAEQEVLRAGKASTSLLQRRLGIGYGRAARIMDTLEENGIIEEADGSKPRRVIVAKEQ